MKISGIIILWISPLLAVCQVPILDIANAVVDTSLPKSLVETPAIPTIDSYNSYESKNQQNYDRIFAEVDAHFSKNSHTTSAINDAVSYFNKPSIQYTFPPSKRAGKEHFYKAFKELGNMLSGKNQMDLMRAVYLVEHAYDPTIPFEYFDINIKEAANHILMKMEQSGFELSDNLAKNMMLFQYMTDTVEVNYSGIEKPIVSYPKIYDFNDFFGRRDYSNMFVSKLLSQGNGQCHSLPLLYLMIAEKIGAEASLAFAPNHSYIKFKDPLGNWQSVELTVGAISSENFIIESGFVKSEAIRNKIYLNPISKKQLIAQTVNDLIMAYTKKYGHDDDVFIEQAFELVYKNFPNSITAHQIMANYYQDRLNYVVRQYRANRLSKEQFEKDEMAQRLLTQVKGSNKHIDNLGYAQMPEEAYQLWLEAVKKKAQGQYSNVRMEQLNNLIKK